MLCYDLQRTLLLVLVLGSFLVVRIQCGGDNCKLCKLLLPPCCDDDNCDKCRHNGDSNYYVTYVPAFVPYNVFQKLSSKPKTSYQYQSGMPPNIAYDFAKTMDDLAANLQPDMKSIILKPQDGPQQPGAIAAGLTGTPGYTVYSEHYEPISANILRAPGGYIKVNTQSDLHPGQQSQLPFGVALNNHPQPSNTASYSWGVPENGGFSMNFQPKPSDHTPLDFGLPTAQKPFGFSFNLHPKPNDILTKTAEIPVNIAPKNYNLGVPPNGGFSVNFHPKPSDYSPLDFGVRRTQQSQQPFGFTFNLPPNPSDTSPKTAELPAFIVSPNDNLGVPQSDGYPVNFQSKPSDHSPFDFGLQQPFGFSFNLHPKPSDTPESLDTPQNGDFSVKYEPQIHHIGVPQSGGYPGHFLLKPSDHIPLNFGLQTVQKPEQPFGFSFNSQPKPSDTPTKTAEFPAFITSPNDNLGVTQSGGYPGHFLLKPSDHIPLNFGLQIAQKPKQPSGLSFNSQPKPSDIPTKTAEFPAFITSPNSDLGVPQSGGYPGHFLLKPSDHIPLNFGLQIAQKPKQPSFNLHPEPSDIPTKPSEFPAFITSPNNDLGVPQNGGYPVNFQPKPSDHIPLDFGLQTGQQPFGFSFNLQPKPSDTPTKSTEFPAFTTSPNNHLGVTQSGGYPVNFQPKPSDHSPLDFGVPQTGGYPVNFQPKPSDHSHLNFELQKAQKPKQPWGLSFNLHPKPSDTPANLDTPQSADFSTKYEPQIHHIEVPQTTGFPVNFQLNPDDNSPTDLGVPQIQTATEPSSFSMNLDTKPITTSTFELPNTQIPNKLAEFLFGIKPPTSDLGVPQNAGFAVNLQPRPSNHSPLDFELIKTPQQPSGFSFDLQPKSSDTPTFNLDTPQTVDYPARHEPQIHNFEIPVNHQSKMDDNSPRDSGKVTSSPVVEIAANFQPGVPQTATLPSGFSMNLQTKPITTSTFEIPSTQIPNKFAEFLFNIKSQTSDSDASPLQPSTFLLNLLPILNNLGLPLKIAQSPNKPDQFVITLNIIPQSNHLGMITAQPAAFLLSLLTKLNDLGIPLRIRRVSNNPNQLLIETNNLGAPPAGFSLTVQRQPVSSFGSEPQLSTHHYTIQPQIGLGASLQSPQNVQIPKDQSFLGGNVRYKIQQPEVVETVQNVANRDLQDGVTTVRSVSDQPVSPQSRGNQIVYDDDGEPHVRFQDNLTPVSDYDSFDDTDSDRSATGNGAKNTSDNHNVKKSNGDFDYDDSDAILPKIYIPEHIDDYDRILMDDDRDDHSSDSTRIGDLGPFTVTPTAETEPTPITVRHDTNRMEKDRQLGMLYNLYKPFSNLAGQYGTKFDLKVPSLGGLFAGAAPTGGFNLNLGGGTLGGQLGLGTGGGTGGLGIGGIGLGTGASVNLGTGGLGIGGIGLGGGTGAGTGAIGIGTGGGTGASIGLGTGGIGIGTGTDGIGIGTGGGTGAGIGLGTGGIGIGTGTNGIGIGTGAIGIGTGGGTGASIGLGTGTGIGGGTGGISIGTGASIGGSGSTVDVTGNQINTGTSGTGYNLDITGNQAKYPTGGSNLQINSGTGSTGYNSDITGNQIKYPIGGSGGTDYKLEIAGNQANQPIGASGNQIGTTPATSYTLDIAGNQVTYPIGTSGIQINSGTGGSGTTPSSTYQFDITTSQVPIGINFNSLPVGTNNQGTYQRVYQLPNGTWVTFSSTSTTSVDQAGLPIGIDLKSIPIGTNNQGTTTYQQFYQLPNGTWVKYSSSSTTNGGDQPIGIDLNGLPIGTNNQGGTTTYQQFYQLPNGTWVKYTSSSTSSGGDQPIGIDLNALPIGTNNQGGTTTYQQFYQLPNGTWVKYIGDQPIGIDLNALPIGTNNQGGGTTTYQQFLQLPNGTWVPLNNLPDGIDLTNTKVYNITQTVQTITVTTSTDDGTDGTDHTETHIIDGKTPKSSWSMDLNQINRPQIESTTHQQYHLRSDTNLFDQIMQIINANRGVRFELTFAPNDLQNDQIYQQLRSTDQDNLKRLGILVLQLLKYIRENNITTPTQINSEVIDTIIKDVLQMHLSDINIDPKILAFIGSKLLNFNNLDFNTPHLAMVKGLIVEMLRDQRLLDLKTFFDANNLRHGTKKPCNCSD